MANEPTQKSWQNQVSELLARAARLCVDNNVDMDPFIRGAYSAYLEARPGMREYLEELQLKETLQAMREGGKIATA
ncbi:MAG TPA: hypothetical protein VIV40_33670 [Kofleriaceae bacterium]